MLWGAAQDKGLLHFYRALIAVRRSGGDRWRRDRATLIADDKTKLLAYRCGTGSQRSIVVIHAGDGEAVTSLDRLGARDLRPILATDPGAVTMVADAVRLGPWTGVVLEVAGRP